MNFMKIILFLSIFLYSISALSQIISCEKIDYQDLDFFKNITYENIEEELLFKENYQHLENVILDSIHYLSDGLDIKGFVIKPKNINDERIPLILFNRGGNKDFGNLTAKMMIYNLSYIASKGYIIAGSTYRGNKNSEGSDEFGGKDVNDVINLINFMKKEPYVDSTKIAMYGWSRGAMMSFKALRELNESKLIKTIIIGGTPSNLFETLEERPEMENKVFLKTIPKYKYEKKSCLEDRSVVFWVDKLPKIPMLIIHGINDRAVSVNQSLKLVEELKMHSVPSKLVIYEDEGHNIHNNKDELDYIILNWLKKYL